MGNGKDWAGGSSTGALCTKFTLVYVDSTSVEHSSLGFKVWNGKICIVCSHVEEKMNCLRFLKGNMDSHIDFCLVLTQKTCSRKGKGLLIIHFNTFIVRNWVHIWENKIYLLNSINSILIEDTIIMSLIQLGNGNGLQLVGDIFELTKTTISMIVNFFLSHPKVESLKIIYVIFEWVSI